jgi:hypothetical protein
LAEFVAHHQHERNHQGKGNIMLFPRAEDRIGETLGLIRTRQVGRDAEFLPHPDRMSFLTLGSGFEQGPDTQRQFGPLSCFLFREDDPLGK